MPDSSVPKNINVAVCGHVNAGKTTLCKALSTRSSTNAFDKSPESQRRGMTLDLGASFWTSDDQPNRITFIDCPGHAEFIKTIICGISVCDLLLILVDACKGFQQQTNESFIFAKIFKLPIIVILSKIDTIPDASRQKRCTYLRKMIETNCKTKGLILHDIFEFSSTIEHLVQTRTNICNSILNYNAIKNPEEEEVCDEKNVLFVYDHVFHKGNSNQIFTGNLLRGMIKVLELPKANMYGKIKSINSYNESLQRAERGNRVGVLMTSASFLGLKEFRQRGFACKKGNIQEIWSLDCSVTFIKNSGTFKSKMTLCISALNETFIATALFYDTSSSIVNNGDEYYESVEEVEMIDDCQPKKGLRVQLKVSHGSIFLPEECTYIALSHDLTISEKNSSPRILFYGCSHKSNWKSNEGVRFYSKKSLSGIVERFGSKNEIIIRDLFDGKQSIKYFQNMKLCINNIEAAYIVAPFGNKGKIIARCINENIEKIEENMPIVLNYYKSKNHSNRIFQ